MNDDYVSEAKDLNPEPKGMWVMTLAMFGLVFAAAFLQSFWSPHDGPYSLSIALLILSTAISIGATYLWWRYIPNSIIMFGPLSICCAGPLYGSVNQ